MRVKKKDLRKRLAQLPINYPGPVIEEPFNYDKEANRVENLCRRLADNEVETRDSCLAEVPRFIREVCSRTEFVALAKQQSLPKDFSYEKLSDFLTSTDQGSVLISNRAANSANEEYRVLFSQPLRDLSLIFDKLNLGLFYCLWHSDKPLIQHECALNISALCHTPPSIILKILFWRSMWKALSAKWSIIDHHRLDKYMAYVRKLLYQSFRDICDITIEEAQPLVYNVSNSGKKGEQKILSSDEILQDAMRLVGNDYVLQKWTDAKSSFKNKLAKHLEEKKKRREEHEAAMEAKKNKKFGKKAEETTAVAGKKGQQPKQNQQQQPERVSKAIAVTGKPNNNNSAKPRETFQPAAALFLTAFSDLIRTEVFQVNSSVGLAMHIADVILDEIRRYSPLHKYPSVILALLFAVPFRAMSSGDVLQIERRVQMLIVQPISGGIFERFFKELQDEKSSNNKSGSRQTKKPIRKGPSLNAEAKGDVDWDDEDDEFGTFSDDDEFDDEKVLKSSNNDDDDDDANHETPPEIIAKSVNLAEAISKVLAQIGLDPRTKFLMRPLFEEASRTVKAYVLHRKMPEEFAVVTPAEKRKMLIDAVHKRVNAKKNSDDDANAVPVDKTASKKQILIAKMIKKTNDPAVLKVLRRKKEKLEKLKLKREEEEKAAGGAAVVKAGKKKQLAKKKEHTLAVKSKRRRLNAKKKKM
jgi:hypothetical protein